MKLWLLLIAMVLGAALIVITLVQFAELYGGDWDYIASTVAGFILVITVFSVLVVMVKQR